MEDYLQKYAICSQGNTARFCQCLKGLYMRIVWKPIEYTMKIPPLGDELRAHLLRYKGARFAASCSVWNLLYSMMEEQHLPADRVIFTESGKPCFAELPYSFSLSHSKDVCAAALSDRPVGIDIESCRSSYKPRLIERSLAPAEKEIFDGDFTRVWVRKEAVAKMTGKGITGFPNDIDTTKYCFEEYPVIYKGEKYWLAATLAEQKNPEIHF